MQKAIIVSGNSPSATSELNILLKQGWRVHSMCAMPSAVSTSMIGESYNYRDQEIQPTCLVIIEK